MVKALQLLAVEAFAGTHPVAQVLKHLNSTVHNALGARLQAYAGIEIQEQLVRKAPSAADLDIKPKHFLNFTGQHLPGDITSLQVQQTVLDFVRRQLQDKQLGIDAAIVFGGPTWTVYSNLTRENIRFPHRYKGYAAEAEHTAIIRQLAVARKKVHDLQSSSSHSVDVPASSRDSAARQAVLAAAAVAKRADKTQQEAVASTQSLLAQQQQQQHLLLPPAAAALLAATQAEEELAAQEAALRQRRHLFAEKAGQETLWDASALWASDNLVGSFITLYRGVQAECMAYGDIPSYVIMENPYSVTGRALWNRPFMKAQHLLNLPVAPAAERVRQQTNWKPSSTAWLSCTWQNWCCYSAQHSQKNTVVFTNLPEGALQDRRCSQHCLVPFNDSAAAAAAAAGGSSKPGRKTGRHVHPVSVRSNPGGAVANAAWPLPFVESAMKACVSVMRQRQGDAAGAAGAA